MKRLMTIALVALALSGLAMAEGTATAPATAPKAPGKVNFTKECLAEKPELKGDKKALKACVKAKKAAVTK